jgi:hypothetical protein
MAEWLWWLAKRRKGGIAQQLNWCDGGIVTWQDGGMAKSQDI